MNAPRARVQITSLVRAWLLLDFFGDARRSGNQQGSSLTTTIMWQALVALVFAALLYPDVAPVPFVAANLCLSTLLIGIAALGDEERPLRRAADDGLIATSPMSRTAVVIARSAHAAFHLVLLTCGMALPPAILHAYLRGDALQGLGYVAAAIACSGLAMALLATLRLAFERLVGGARTALLMGSVKAVLLGGGFVLFALGLRTLQATADALPIGRGGAELLPMYHAARWLAEPSAESWRVLVWLAVGAALLLASVALQRTASSRRTRASTGGPLRGLVRRLADRGPRLGIAEFVATSMWRSAGFRARVLPLLGLPAGMVFLTIGAERDNDFVFLCLLLQLPAIYLPFLIAFLPRADHAGTGWVFAHAPGIDLRTVQDATWRALVTHVLVPVHVVALVLMVAVGPDRLDRAAASLFAFALAVLASERMARTIDRVPFTDDREADRGLELGALMAGALVLGALGTAFGGWLPPLLRWPAAALALVLAALQLRRRPAAATDAPVSFAGQQPEPAAEATIDRQQEPPQVPSSQATTHAIRGELRAIAVLYGVLSLLPWMIGAAFAP